MFLIEGSDNLGKTTAAKTLIKLCNTPDCPYPIRYGHMSRPNEDVFNFGSDYMDLISVFAVQDRFHIGGMFYHPNRISLPALRWIEGQMQIRGSFTVLLVAKETLWYEEHLRKFQKEEMFDIKYMLEANEFFIHHAERTLAGDLDDFRFDVIHDVSEDQFVTETQLFDWKQKWFERLAFLEEA